MKSFLLTSRCTFVREWLAPQIMEGLTAHLGGHLEIKDHLFAAAFEYDWNVHVRSEVCYMHVLQLYVHQQISEGFSHFISTV